MGGGGMRWRRSLRKTPCRAGMLQQWGIYWLTWSKCIACFTEGWWSYSNLQPYSSIKMWALMWYNYSLCTFTWSVLRFPVAGLVHDMEYSSTRGGPQGLFDGNNRHAVLNEVVRIMFRGDYTLLRLQEENSRETQRHQRLKTSDELPVINKVTTESIT